VISHLLQISSSRRGPVTFISRLADCSDCVVAAVTSVVCDDVDYNPSFHACTRMRSTSIDHHVYDGITCHGRTIIVWDDVVFEHQV